MGEATANVLPFAIACNLSPLALIALILLLFSARAESNVIIFLAAWAVTLALAVGIVAMFSGLLGHANVASAGAIDAAVTYFRILLGAVLLVLGLRRVSQRIQRIRTGTDQEPSVPGWITGIDSFTPPRVFGVTVLLAFLGNLPWILAAGLGIARAKVSLGQSLLAIVVFVVIGSIAVGTIILFYFIWKTRARKWLSTWKIWLTTHNLMMSAVVFLTFAVFLLVQGIRGLGL